MNAPLVQSIEGLLPSLLWLPADRKQLLDRIATFVAARRADRAPVRLTFIRPDDRDLDRILGMGVEDRLLHRTGAVDTRRSRRRQDRD